MHFLQIWIVPEKRGLKPAYAERSAAAAKPGTLNLVASQAGRDGSIRINQDSDLWLAKFAGGEKLGHELSPGRHAWVHVAEGNVQLNGTPLGAGDGAAVTGESQLQLAADGKAQVLLFDMN